MEPRRGRPRTGVMGSFESTIRDKVDSYRPDPRSGWGALTIQVELGQESALQGYKQPSRSTIAAYLKSRNKVRTYGEKRVSTTVPCYPAAAAHDLWQLDAEGNREVNALGTSCMLNLKDSFSKAYVGSLPLVFEKPRNHPKAKHYQYLLRLAFLEFGMNKRLQTDHESVFFDNKSSSPFPTSLHLWLIGLGIELCYTPSGKPQKQGMVERAHQTMYQQVIAGQTFDNYEQLFSRCQQRRNRLNHLIPSASTQKLPPLVACPNAVKSPRHYQVDMEEKIFDLDNIKNYLRQQKWFRSVSKDKTVSLGGWVYYLPKAIPKMQVEIRFNYRMSTFIFIDANKTKVNSRPAQGLTFKELAGNLEEFIRFRESPVRSP
jgi:ribosome modulation factor